MTQAADPDGAAAGGGQGGPDQDSGGPVAWLDWAGAAAAVILAVILADIWSGGRVLSARLWRWRNGGGSDEGERPAGD